LVYKFTKALKPAPALTYTFVEVFAHFFSTNNEFSLKYRGK